MGPTAAGTAGQKQCDRWRSLKGAKELSWATRPALYQSGRFKRPTALNTCEQASALAVPDRSEKPCQLERTNGSEQPKAQAYPWNEDACYCKHGPSAVDQLCLLVPASGQGSALSWFA